MKPEMYVILGIFIVFIVLEILLTRFWRKPDQTRRDALVEIIGSAALIGLTQPAILATAYALGLWLFPAQEGALAGIPLVAGVLLFLVLDDMTQYWWHRASHTVPWLYDLHRAHHDAKYMSVRLVYRNNIFYYWLMPGLWFSGALIFLGLGWIYAGYIVVKMLVIIGAHSDVAWDAPLIRAAARHRWLRPVLWVVERTISTPATHHAHHGRHKSDGVTHYKGNFGNLLFFWDVLFGTAHITRRYPDAYGVENLPEVGAGRLLLWPLVRGREAASEVIAPAE